ncbi:hypothetical protein EVAR_36318_1 [Eumeta japonica]|uniref:Uncharacterized protein n=1 Tax=Eumeta variegata TaxID=151549 RepID=A0A4C1VHE5_EUMVA|nr:hypothetical protein EVAR_36318_1 [Eumeta japonica]
MGLRAQQKSESVLRREYITRRACLNSTAQAADGAGGRQRAPCHLHSVREAQCSIHTKKALSRGKRACESLEYKSSPPPSGPRVSERDATALPASYVGAGYLMVEGTGLWGVEGG